MLIHAFRRTQAVSIDTGCGHIDFKPNDLGHVVALVEDEAPRAVLLAITEGYKPYPIGETELIEAPAPVPPVPEAPVFMGSTKGPEPASIAGLTSTETAPAKTASAFVISNDEGDKLDLSGMDDAALKTFAKTNGIKVHNFAKGDTLRSVIVDALTAARDQE
jgi:hypothetical protein